MMVGLNSIGAGAQSLGGGLAMRTNSRGPNLNIGNERNHNEVSSYQNNLFYKQTDSQAINNEPDSAGLGCNVGGLN